MSHYLVEKRVKSRVKGIVDQMNLVNMNIEPAVLLRWQALEQLNLRKLRQRGPQIWLPEIQYYRVQTPILLLLQMSAGALQELVNTADLIFYYYHHPNILRISRGALQIKIYPISVLNSYNIASSFKGNLFKYLIKVTLHGTYFKQFGVVLNFLTGAQLQSKLERVCDGN